MVLFEYFPWKFHRRADVKEKWSVLNLDLHEHVLFSVETTKVL